MGESPSTENTVVLGGENQDSDQPGIDVGRHSESHS